MRKGLGIVCFCVLISATSAAVATSYMMVADEDLADGAVAIAIVSVQARQVLTVGSTVFTEVIAHPERVLKGTLPDAVRLRHLGGLFPDGHGTFISGMPELVAGERALVFLSQRADGTYGFEHLQIGVFRLRTIEGREIAYRNMPEAELALADPRRARRRQSLLRSALPRDLDRFATWLEQRAVGGDAPAEYYLDEDFMQRHPLAKFTVFVDGSGNNFHFHQFSPGAGGRLTLVMNKKGLKGLKQKGAKMIKKTVAKWSKIFNIDWKYGGKDKGATGGLSVRDGRHGVIFGDPNSEISGSFNCSTGGVLAIGGFHNSSGPTHVATGKGKKRRYWDIGESDTVFQDGIQCTFPNAVGGGDVLAEAIMGHELGHGMGINHSCGDDASGPCNTSQKNDALMRAFIQEDGRGAAIKNDDKKAAKALDYKR